ncbi:MAG: cryptochrome/photolyase family protein [Beijerinckiaceae bacterium]
MSGTLRVILGDQLTHDMAALASADPKTDIILMMEVADETAYVKHHKHKIILILSAMRHFAGELRARGLTVDYVQLDDKENTGSLTTEVQRAVARHHPARIIITEPGEWRVLQMIEGWHAATDIPVIIRDDDRFLSARQNFSAWAQGREQLRMEYFYREMRRKTGYLMENGKPAGGEWNYDASNRKRLPGNHVLPARSRFDPDSITQAVMALVNARCAGHIGKSENFGWAVTRANALKALDYFIRDCLAGFGDFQDAMRSGDDFLYHATLSPYLNCGLLTPREVCDRAVAAYHAGAAPLAAVEGFVRQIIGWREFVRGLYWHVMPGYGDSNHFSATAPLPDFFWTGRTDMHCMADALRNTIENAYAHHIQRLMVIGNYALLAGLDPKAVQEWFLLVYADAYEWVELPNVHGMALHADGGLLASKPYAASGAYINRMSNYCGQCAYDVKSRTGPKACPFNILFWQFLDRHRSYLSKNPRMANLIRNLDRAPKEPAQDTLF